MLGNRGGEGLKRAGDVTAIERGYLLFDVNRLCGLFAFVQITFLTLPVVWLSGQQREKVFMISICFLKKSRIFAKNQGKYARENEWDERKCYKATS